MLGCGRASLPSDQQECGIERTIMADDPGDNEEKMGDAELRAPDSWELWQPGPLQLQRNDPSWFDENSEIPPAPSLPIPGRSVFGRVPDGPVIANGNCRAAHAAPNFINRSNYVNKYSSNSFASADRDDFDLQNQLVHPGDGSISSKNAPAFYCGGRQEDGDDDDDGSCSTPNPTTGSPQPYRPDLLNDDDSSTISPSIYAPGTTSNTTTDSSSNPSPVPAFIDKFSSPIHSWFTGKSLSTCSCNGMRFRSSCSVGSGRAGSPSRRRNRIRDVCCCISVTGRRRGRSLSGTGGKWSNVGEQWDDDEGGCCGGKPSVTSSRSGGGRSSRRRMWLSPKTLCLFALGISFGLTVMLFLHTTMRYGAFSIKTEFTRTSSSRSQFSESEPKNFFPNSGEGMIVNSDKASLNHRFAEHSQIYSPPGCGYNSLRPVLAVLFGGASWRSVFSVEPAAGKQFKNSGRPAADSDIFTSLPKSVTGDEGGNPSDDDDGLMVMKQGGEWGESEELGGNLLPPNKQLVLVGVMTAGQYLHSRAAAIAATWASSIPGKVIFFVGENQERGKDSQLGGGNSEDVGQDAASVIPEFLPGSKLGTAFEVVKLEGVNDWTYPPQKKSFLMLKYMADHYGDQFEWFMRADDDVFVRGERLALMLRSINSSRPLFLGQTGLGNKEEYGQLSLGDRGNYCMGGTGMILSRATLAAIHGRIRECLHGLYTGHEDVEVGRCIRRWAGVSCTWAYEMQSIFYNNQNGSRLYAGELNVPAVEQAVTLHPLKQPELLHRLHAHFVRRRLDDGNFRLLQLRRHLGAVGLALASDGLLDHMGLGPHNMDMNVEPSLLKYRPLSPKDLQSWEFLSPTLVYCAGGVMCPRHALGTSQRRAFQDVVKQILYLMNRHARQRGRVLEFTEMLYGYRRVDPLHGVDYIMDLLLMYKKFKGKRVTVPVRRHAYLQQSFADMEFIEVLGAAGADSATKGAAQTRDRSLFAPPVQASPSVEAVHIILPLSGRLSTFQRFLSHFERTCLSPTLDAGSRQTADANADFFDVNSQKPPNSAHLCGSVSILVVYFDAPVGTASNSNNPDNDNQRRKSVDNHDGQRSKRSFLRIFDNLKLPQTVIADQPEQISDFEQIKRLLNELINRYPGRVLDFQVIKADGEFSRGRAMMEGARWSPPDALLFLTDVDILFTAEAIYRIRQNVQRGRTVYFPMVFSEYDPGFVQQFGSRQLVEQFRYSDHRSPNFKDLGGEQQQGLRQTPPPGYFGLKDAPSMEHTESAKSKETTTPQWPDHFSSLDDDHGYFRHFGFGIAAMYRSDLFAVGGYNLSIRGWGLEDVDLFERCVKYTVNNLTLFRAPDPGLIHVYHAVKCDRGTFPSAAQYRMCLGSKAASFASKEVLANAVMSLLDGGTGRLKNF